MLNALGAQLLPKSTADLQLCRLWRNCCVAGAVVDNNFANEMRR
jgi:hypothetical protein